MPRRTYAEKIRRASALREAAVDLVERQGSPVFAKAPERILRVMTHENDGLAVLYKTPSSISATRVFRIT